LYFLNKYKNFILFRAFRRLKPILRRRVLKLTSLALFAAVMKGFLSLRALYLRKRLNDNIVNAKQKSGRKYYRRVVKKEIFEKFPLPIESKKIFYFFRPKRLKFFKHAFSFHSYVNHTCCGMQLLSHWIMLIVFPLK
jgi:hypothetical protein